MVISYAVRIQRIQRKRDECWTQLAHQEPGSRTDRFLRARITNYQRAIASLERLEYRAALMVQRRVAGEAIVAARAESRPRPAAGVSTPQRVDFAGSRAPMPSDAATYKPARDSELELVLVWTPHRDAPSLIGAYDSRPRA